MNYLALRERPAQFLALTSLHPAEFDDLLTAFAPFWERYHRYHTLDGDRRKIPAHRERANATLAGPDTKLFFLLTYLKTKFLQEHQAASFGLSQTRVSRLAGPLLEGLNQALAARHVLPVRDGAQRAQRLADHPDKVFTYDGVERGIPRNADWEGQKEEYSAKKKTWPDQQHLVRRHAVPALPFTHRIGAGPRQKSSRRRPATLAAGQRVAPGFGLSGPSPAGGAGRNAAQKNAQRRTNFFATALQTDAKPDAGGHRTRPQRH